MPSGPGYWLDPRSGTLHEVTTHNDWLLVPENQAKVGLSAREICVLNGLDPLHAIDEIRMVGVIAGLIRIRDYLNRISVQFFASENDTTDVLEAVATAIPGVTGTPFPFLTIQNLYNDSTAHIELESLKQKLREREPILESPPKPLTYNIALREKMAHLLADTNERGD